jgi:hypothetical protein
MSVNSITRFFFFLDMMVAHFFVPQAITHLGSGDSKNQKKDFLIFFRPHSLRNLWYNLNAAHF